MLSIAMNLGELVVLILTNNFDNILQMKVDLIEKIFRTIVYIAVYILFLHTVMGKLFIYFYVNEARRFYVYNSELTCEEPLGRDEMSIKKYLAFGCHSLSQS